MWIEPCGTPAVTSNQEDKQPLSITRKRNPIRASKKTTQYLGGVTTLTLIKA